VELGVGVGVAVGVTVAVGVGVAVAVGVEVEVEVAVAVAVAVEVEVAVLLLAPPSWERGRGEGVDDVTAGAGTTPSSEVTHPGIVMAPGERGKRFLGPPPEYCSHIAQVHQSMSEPCANTLGTMEVPMVNAPDPSTLDSTHLARRLAELAGEERTVLVEFLLHLEEFDRRRAWAEAGYDSLWNYCPEPELTPFGAAIASSTPSAGGNTTPSLAIVAPDETPAAVSAPKPATITPVAAETFSLRVTLDAGLNQLHAEHLFGAEQMARFRRSVTGTGGIAHPGIVNV
jgi:hypothetical protein